MGHNITPDPENARNHPPENEALIRASLDELGAGRSILLDKNGLIIAGNETFRQAEKLGLPVRIVESDGRELIAIRRADLEGRRAVRLGILDNQASDLSEFSAESLLQLAKKYGEETVTEGIFSEAQWLKIINEPPQQPPSETKEKKTEPGAGVALIGIKRQRWSFRHGVGFFAVRSFQTPTKRKEIEILKGWKAAGDQVAAAGIAGEVAALLTQTFRAFGSDWAITQAPENRTGFARLVCSFIADILGIERLDIFQQENQTARRIFGDRPQITAAGPVNYSNLILFDDTLTTGRTLSGCLDTLPENQTTIPLVWIYDDANPE